MKNQTAKKKSPPPLPFPSLSKLSKPQVTQASLHSVHVWAKKAAGQLAALSALRETPTHYFLSQDLEPKLANHRQAQKLTQKPRSLTEGYIPPLCVGLPATDQEI